MMPGCNFASYNGMQNEIRVFREMKYGDACNAHGIWAAVSSVWVKRNCLFHLMETGVTAWSTKLCG